MEMQACIYWQNLWNTVESTLKKSNPLHGEIGVEFFEFWWWDTAIDFGTAAFDVGFLFFDGDGADDGQQDPGADAGGEWR